MTRCLFGISPSSSGQIHERLSADTLVASVNGALMVDVARGQQRHGRGSTVVEDSLNGMSCFLLLCFLFVSFLYLTVCHLIISDSLQTATSRHDRNMAVEYRLDKVSCFDCCVFFFCATITPHCPSFK